MKQILLIVMLAMLTESSVSAQTQKKDTHPIGSIESQLIELERQMSDALVKQDAVTLDRLWSRDLVFTFPSGTVSDKSKRISAQKPSDASADSTNINDLVKVNVYGKTAVVTVLSTWKGKAGTQEYSEQYQATHVWIKQQGRWQLVAAHVSQVKK